MKSENANISVQDVSKLIEILEHTISEMQECIDRMKYRMEYGQSNLDDYECSYDISPEDVLKLVNLCKKNH